MQGDLWKLSDGALTQQVFQQRYFAVDSATGTLSYWHDAAAAEAKRSKGKLLNIFALDTLELRQQPPREAKAGSGLVGTLTLELRKGHTDHRKVVLAAEDIATLRAWSDAILALSNQAHQLPMRHLLEHVSALRLATPVAQPPRMAVEASRPRRRLESPVVCLACSTQQQRRWQRRGDW